PRLPAWYQPPARPFCDCSVECAIRFSAAMARKLTATLLTKTRTVMANNPDWVAGKNPIAASVAALTIAAMRYQFLLVSVVSKIGADKAFQVCGSRLIATSRAMAPTLTPAWARR